MDQWVDIPGFGGVYQISRTGAVRKVSFGKVRDIAVCRASNGKSVVYLHLNGKQSCHMLHKLYAAAFGISETEACHILYSGFPQNEEAGRHVREMLREKIAECVRKGWNDEALFLWKLLETVHCSLKNFVSSSHIHGKTNRRKQ